MLFARQNSDDVTGRATDGDRRAPLHAGDDPRQVAAGERLDFEDGVTLFETDDLLALGELADLARRQRGGDDRVFFVQNLYLNQTNVCRVKCRFCAFAVTQKEEGAYTYTATSSSRTRCSSAR